MKISEKYDWETLKRYDIVGENSVDFKDKQLADDLVKTAIVLTDDYVKNGSKYDWKSIDNCPGALFASYLTGVPQPCYLDHPMGEVVSMVISYIMCQPHGGSKNWRYNWQLCRDELMKFFGFSEDDITNHRQFV